MTRTTVAVGFVRTMLFFLIVAFAAALPTGAVISVAPLEDCPKIPPKNDLNIDQITGSWRLAYLFIDETDDLEEDKTCAVAEIIKVNDTLLELLLYVDGRKDEFTIDRYAKQFDVSIISPAEWVLHTSFMHMEFIHITVIDFTPDHVILTFCVNPFDAAETPEPVDEYDAFFNTVDTDSMDDIFKAQHYNQLFKELDELNSRLERQKRVRRPSRRLRGKRFASEEPFQEEGRHERMMKYLKASKTERKTRKHLWTAILVKDNNISALKFVENASLLMKFGYKITNGQLVSFGGCTLNKK